MILRRLAEAIREQNWFTVFIEFLIVVAGIFVGLQVDDWNQARSREARSDRVIEAIRKDVEDRLIVQVRFRVEIEAGLDAWQEARAGGLTPPPFVFRIDGAESAPDGIWQTLTQEGLVDLMEPSLVFDLGFYYSEARGMGLRYVRYAEFTEAEVLPWLGRADETAHFYDSDGVMKPRFRAHMERLRELGDMWATLLSWEECLLGRLETPRAATAACRSGFGANRAGAGQEETKP